MSHQLKVNAAIAGITQRSRSLEGLMLLCLVVFSILHHASHVRAWYDPFNGTDIDEVVIHYEMRELFFRGTPAENRSLAGYPPVVLGLHWLGHAAIALPAGDWQASYAFEVINLLRWWSILPATAALLLAYGALRMLVSTPMALVTTLVFVVSPLITLERTNAITEPWQLLFVSGALVAFLLALRYQHVGWSVASAVLGCLAVATKYSNFPILGLGASAALWLFIHDRRKGILSGALQALVIAVTAGLLLFAYDARFLLGVRELNTFFSGGNTTYTNWYWFWQMLYTVSKQFLLPDQLALVGLLAASVLWLLKASHWQRYALIMMMIVAVCLAMTTLMYTIFWALINRYLIPLTVIMMVWLGVGLQGLRYALEHSAAPRIADQRRQAALTAALMVIVAVVWAGPAIHQWLSSPRGLPRIEHQVVSWLQDRYFDETLLISNDIFQLLWFYFDREYSGYKGQLPPWYRGVLGDQPISAWRDMYIRYVWMYPESRAALMEAHPAYFDEMTLLRHFRPYPHSAWAGDDVFIYELVALRPAEIAFANGLEIVGFAQQRCEHTDGMLTIHLAPYWRTQQPQTVNLQLFLHVTPDGSPVILQQVDQLVAPDNYPMVDWETEDNAIRGRPIQLRAELAAESDLVVKLGLYSLETLQRVPLTNGTDFVEVCRLSS